MSTFTHFLDMDWILCMYNERAPSLLGFGQFITDYYIMKNIAKHLRMNYESTYESKCHKIHFLTVLTTSFKIAALSGLVAFMSRLLICRNSPNCSMNSFSCSRRRFSLLHLLICDCGCELIGKRKEKQKNLKSIFAKFQKDSSSGRLVTLLSDLRRIFFDAVGGHATAEATAFIIFA